MDWLSCAAALALYPAGLWTGLWIAKANLNAKAELAQMVSRALRRDEQATENLSRLSTQTEAMTKMVESLSQATDRMDLSVGRMADVLVQRGLARVANRDLQVGEGEGIEPPAARPPFGSRELDRPT